MILFRLRKDGEIVGYEFHLDTPKGLRIYHAGTSDLEEASKAEFWWDITYAATYRPHTSKDRYTGIDVDKVKMFENDIVSGVTYKEPVVCRTSKTITGTVKFGKGAFGVNWKLPNGYRTYPNLYGKYIKIIGIEGVK